MSAAAATKGAPIQLVGPFIEGVMGPLTQRPRQPIAGCLRPTCHTTRAGWIQAAYLEVNIGGTLCYTTKVVQIKRLTNSNQIVVNFLFCLFLLLGMGRQRPNFFKKRRTPHMKKTTNPYRCFLPHQKLVHMDCLGQAGKFVTRNVKNTITQSDILKLK